MRYSLFSLLILISGCSSQIPVPPIEPILETGAITSTGSLEVTPETPPRNLTEGDIKGLVEAELAKNNLAGRWTVELGDITEVEATDMDGKSYTIYEGGLSGPCTAGSTEPCSGERFFLVTDGSESLYFEHTTDAYRCEGVDNLLTDDILDLTRELFCP